jgi:hypothetical protein
MGLFEINGGGGGGGTTYYPFIGDSGSGGSEGLVPAPPAGSAAANEFLNANGSWKQLPASGSWIAVNTATYQMVTNSQYRITYSANGCSLNLPLTFNAGDEIWILGHPTYPFDVTLNAGQNILQGNASTSMGTSGYLSTSSANGTLLLVGSVANTTFTVFASDGTFYLF